MTATGRAGTSVFMAVICLALMLSWKSYTNQPLWLSASVVFLPLCPLLLSQAQNVRNPDLTVPEISMSGMTKPIYPSEHAF